MIISASRRTDIPAFYSEWFMERIVEESFVRKNPFNPRQQKVVSLLPEQVDLFIFWSKNPAPMLRNLPVLDEKSYLYYFQFTLNDYPAYFEPGVPPLSDRIGIFKDLSSLIGAEKVIWRYDPIIISNLTPVEYHVKKFNLLAGELKGYTRRVVISFLDFYPKLEPRFIRLNTEYGLQVTDITGVEYSKELHSLAGTLGTVAADKGMEIFSCAEKADLQKCGILHGSCIDADLINQIFNLNLKVKKDKSQRPECLCAESVDMGVYNTCKFGCSYCYANLS